MKSVIDTGIYKILIIITYILRKIKGFTLPQGIKNIEYYGPLTKDETQRGER